MAKEKDFISLLGMQQSTTYERYGDINGLNKELSLQG